MHAIKTARIIGLGLLLWTAAASAAERGYFGFGMAVKGGGFFLNPTVQTIAIASVVPGSPSARARIAVGDSIFKVEGLAVAGRKANELKAAAEREVGQTLHLQLKRPSGELYSVALVAESRPD